MRSDGVTSPRVIVIGLDCAPAGLVFDRLAPRLPFLRSMRRKGASGVLRSIVPPITVPAWAAMMSGLDAGALGVYGFRDRVPGTRTMRTVTSSDIQARYLWDVLAERGLTTTTLFVPPSFPVVPRPVQSISCMLTPADAEVITHPPELRAELEATLGAECLRADVRTEDEADPERLLEALEAQVAGHFDLCEHLLREKPTDLFVMVEMATDRLHHGLWPALDPSDARHPRFAEHRRRAEDVYVQIDRRLARLSEQHPDATLVVVSDHGARSVEGGIYVNELLRRAGLLVLTDEPGRATPIASAAIDEARTVAWGEGGYYARVFLRDDVVGAEREEALTVIERAVSAVTTADGRPLEHRVIRPRAHFAVARGVPPDLLVFFGDLRYRALGAVGTGTIHATPHEVDGGGGRGGCNHDWDGILLASGPQISGGATLEASILDVAPTLLRCFGVDAPADWQGRALFGMSQR